MIFSMKILIFLFVFFFVVGGVRIESSHRYYYPKGLNGLLYPQSTPTPDGGYILTLGHETNLDTEILLLVFDLENNQFLETNFPFANGTVAPFMGFVQNGKYLMTIDPIEYFPIQFWSFDVARGPIFSHSLNYSTTRPIGFVGMFDSCIAIGFDGVDNNLLISRWINDTQLLDPLALYSINPSNYTSFVPLVEPSRWNHNLLYARSGNGFYVYEREGCTLGRIIQEHVFNDTHYINSVFSGDQRWLYAFGDNQIIWSIPLDTNNGLLQLPVDQGLNVTADYRNSFRDTKNCEYYFQNEYLQMDILSRYIISGPFLIGSIGFISLNETISGMQFNVRRDKCISFLNSEAIIIQGGYRVWTNSINGETFNTESFIVYNVTP